MWLISKITHLDLSLLRPCSYLLFFTARSGYTNESNRTWFTVFSCTVHAEKRHKSDTHLNTSLTISCSVQSITNCVEFLQMRLYSQVVGLLQLNPCRKYCGFSMTGMRLMPITTASGPASREQGVTIPWLTWWRGLAESSSPLITATGPVEKAQSNDKPTPDWMSFWCIEKNKDGFDPNQTLITVFVRSQTLDFKH